MTHQVRNLLTFPPTAKKIDVIRSLWRRSKPAGFFAMNPGSKIPAEPTDKQIQRILDCPYVYPTGAWGVIYTYFPKMNPNYNHRQHIDYLYGRAIKITFNTWPMLDVTEYNEYNGENAAEEILETFKKYGSRSLDKIDDSIECYNREAEEKKYKDEKFQIFTLKL